MDKLDNILNRIGFKEFDDVPTLKLICEKAFMDFIKPR
jgi:hypothetical protein